MWLKTEISEVKSSSESDCSETQWCGPRRETAHQLKQTSLSWTKDDADGLKTDMQQDWGVFFFFHYKKTGTFYRNWLQTW